MEFECQGVIEATGNQVSVDNSVLEVRDCAVSQQKIDFSSRREIISSVLVKELPGGDDDVLRRSITDLPPALISEILNCLDPKELGVVSCVSTVLNRLAADNPVWKEVYCERWGHPLTPSLAGVGISDDKSWKELFVEREFRSRTFLGRYSIDVLYGHKEAVRTVFLLASAKLIFTSGYDSVVQMWDMETGLKIASSRPLGCTIRAVAADTKLLVAGGTDGFIQGWKAVDGYPHLFDIKGLEEPAAMFRLWEHVGPITSLALDPMRIYSGSWDMAVRIWDRSSLTCVKVLSHGDWVWSIVPHGTTVASSSGSDVYIWDTLRGTLLNVIAQAHIGNVYALARSHTGEFLFTGGEDGSIHMFEISDNDTLKIASWIAHSGPVYSLAFEFPWLVSSSGDGKMALIDVRKLLRSAKCAPVKCSSKVRKMENKLVEPPQRMLHGFGPDLFAVDIGADRIVCGGEEGVVRIWNFSEALETERRVRALRGVRIENRMRRRKLQSEMGNKSGRSGQCSVAANKNSMKADREVVWHSKRGNSSYCSCSQRRKTKSATMCSSFMDIQMKSTAIIIWVLSFLVLSMTRAQASAVSAMFIMGDSSVDCGENTLFYPILHRNLSLLPCQGSQTSLLPYLLGTKMSFPLSLAMLLFWYTMLVVGEFVWFSSSAAKKMGLSTLPLPFYKQNGTMEEVRSGLNYGSAGGTIMNIDSLSHQCLTQQLRQVLETFQLLELHLGQETAHSFVNKSVFYLSFGKDDYVDIFLARNSTGMRSNEFAEVLVHQVVMVARRLYEGNVRKLVCMGVLPVGCAPRTVWDLGWNSSLIDERTGCIREVNELVLEYNKLLGDAIMELQKELPDAQLVFCDVYQSMMDILTNPANYGFEDTKNACCGLGIHGVVIGCVSEEMACNLTSSPHVWWDLYNPTQLVNSVLADSVWSDVDAEDGESVSSSICHPTGVKGLASSTPLPSYVP
ncbi:F-box/WD-40 repeat-containing protein At5g21040 [Linum perenne]